MLPPSLGSLCLLFSLPKMIFLYLCFLLNSFLSFRSQSYYCFPKKPSLTFLTTSKLHLSFTAPHIDTSFSILITVVILYLSVLLSHHLPVWSSALWTYPTHGAIISGTLFAGYFSRTSSPWSLCICTILSKSLYWFEIGSLSLCVVISSCLMSHLPMNGSNLVASILAVE